MTTVMQDDVIALITHHRARLTGAEGAIADAILADPVRASEATITQLAHAASSSESTVSRFCRTLGLDGFAQLRLRVALAVEHRRSLPNELSFGLLVGDDESETAEELIRRVAFLDSQGIAATLGRLDVPAFEQVVTVVEGARSVLIFGAGASALAAADAGRKLRLIGRSAHGCSDAHEALMTTATLDHRDLVLIFTYSGRIREAVELATQARARGVPTVVVTGDPAAPAAVAADLVLLAAAGPDRFRSGGVVSTVAQLAIVDALFVVLSHRRPEQVARAAGDMQHAVDGLRVGPVAKDRSPEAEEEH